MCICWVSHINQQIRTTTTKCFNINTNKKHLYQYGKISLGRIGIHEFSCTACQGDTSFRLMLPFVPVRLYYLVGTGNAYIK